MNPIHPSSSNTGVSSPGDIETQSGPPTSCGAAMHPPPMNPRSPLGRGVSVPSTGSASILSHGAVPVVYLFDEPSKLTVGTCESNVR